MFESPVSAFAPASPRTTFHIPADEPIIVIRRTFVARRSRVWTAITTAANVRRWWGPRGSALTECRIDLRVGGSWRFVSRMPDGSVHGFGGDYLEIRPEERIVQTFRYDGFPDAVSTETMELAEVGGGTAMTVTVRHASIAARDGHAASMEPGASQSWDRLGELLSRMGPPLHELTFTRTLAAPPDRVFRAWTDPARFRRWFGPRDVAMPTCELDARTGGALRFCHLLPDGRALWVQGTFHDVSPTDRLEFDTVFADEAGNPVAPLPVPDWPADGVMTTEVTLVPSEAGTQMTVRQTVRSADANAAAAVTRERAMASKGWLQTIERLEELLAE
jgi:uncharacterized protein YndB with AHSA1/START domain